MLIALLPVLTIATTETITFDSQYELEDAVSVRLRSAIAAGWTLVDTSPDYEDGGLGFTLTRDGVVERHVITADGRDYRVGPGEVPAHPSRPSTLLLEALRGRGGIRIASRCGVYEEPYLVDAAAVGLEARGLVARSLAAADDLEGAWVHGGRAVFQLETDGNAVELVVTLGEEGGVVGAELRRFGSRDDRTTYRRRGAMARALRGTSVARIESTESDVILRTSRGRFAIDPDGAAYRENRREEDYDGGCGC
jgi:hypothetical protein